MTKNELIGACVAEMKHHTRGANTCRHCRSMPCEGLDCVADRIAEADSRVDELESQVTDLAMQIEGRW